MMFRFLSLILTSISLLGFLLAQEPPAPPEKGDSPLRLKRKNRAEDPLKENKSDPKQKEKTDKDKEKPPPAEKAKDDEPLLPEDGKAVDEVDEQEILERVGRNMRAVEEKIGNLELGEPTVQQQRDIVKDLDSLIRRSEQQSGGGGANQQPQNQEQNQDQNQDQQQGASGQQPSRAQKGSSGSPKSMTQSRGQGNRPRRQLRSERQDKQQGGSSRMLAGGKQPGKGTPQPQPMPMNQPAGQSGMNPGAGGTSPTKDREINTELYKDIWGHLPESLRAEMNAYSNPQPFMPRYDRLIRQYYRTIAEQGRKKGD